VGEVGRSEKQIGVGGGAKKNMIKENCLEKKKCKMEKKGKKRPKKKKKVDQKRNNFIPSMKSSNNIFWMVH
jgi:hypothetical protein